MNKSRDVNDRVLDGSMPFDPGDEIESMPAESAARKTTLRLVSETVPSEDLPLPNDVHAEAALLSTLLWAGTNAPTMTSVATVRDLLERGTMFHSGAHAVIYDAMLAVHGHLSAASVIAVHSELVKQRQERTAGGIDYLEKLVLDARPTSDSALREIATTIRDAWARREMIKLARKLDADARRGRATTPDLIERTHQDLIEMGAKMQTASSFVSFEQCADEVLRDAVAGTPNALPTGLRRLDDVMVGFFPREVTIIAARTSVGKSALSTQLAFAAVENRPSEAAMYVSLEMPAKSFSARVLAGRAGVSLSRIRRQNVTPDEMRRLREAKEEMRSRRVFFVDSQVQSIQSIATTTKRLGAMLAREKCRVSMLVVDHLGLVKPSADSARKQREQQVAEISRGLKWLAQELHCHVIGLAQISRESEKQAGKDKMPQLFHLRESGSIEQDAENILILHRERDKYGRFKPNTPARLAIAKARNDALGLVWLAFDGATGRFAPWEDSDQAKARAPVYEADADDEGGES